MITQKVTPDAFADAVRELMTEYGDEVGQSVKEDVKDIGKKTVELVHQNIDAAGIGGRKYRKSFKDTTTKDTAWITTVEIHSPKHYRLTHLLEFGHVVKRKGKVIGAARAYPHLATAEQEAEELLGRKIAISIRG